MKWKILGGRGGDWVRESGGEYFKMEVNNDKQLVWLRGMMLWKFSDYED